MRVAPVKCQADLEFTHFLASDGPPLAKAAEFNWYTLSRVFVGKSGGGPSRPHKPDLSTTNGKDEEEQELPQIPFATFPCPAHVRA